MTDPDMTCAPASAGAIGVQAAARTFVGGRSHNEDAVGFESVKADWCCVVSDGAGGHEGGAIASTVAVECILTGFRARPVHDPDDLRELILDAHDAVVAAQRQRPANTGQMQATVVVLVIDANVRQAIWGHVGDSRLYLLRRGRIFAITRDDSVVQWMVESGFIEREAARSHPDKNRLFAALGMVDDIHPRISGPPSMLEDGDALLLCSDGWWEYLEDADIEGTFVHAHSPADWLDAMVQLVAARGKPMQDNYSAVGVWVGDPSQKTLIQAAPSAKQAR